MPLNCNTLRLSPFSPPAWYRNGRIISCFLYRVFGIVLVLCCCPSATTSGPSRALALCHRALDARRTYAYRLMSRRNLARRWPTLHRSWLITTTHDELVSLSLPAGTETFESRLTIHPPQRHPHLRPDFPAVCSCNPRLLLRPARSWKLPTPPLIRYFSNRPTTLRTLNPPNVLTVKSSNRSCGCAFPITNPSRSNQPIHIQSNRTCHCDNDEYSDDNATPRNTSPHRTTPYHTTPTITAQHHCDNNCCDDDDN